MTTSKPYHGRDLDVPYGKPTIGPRVYIVESGTGWSETHPRELADESLLRFIQPITIREAIIEYINALRADDEDQNWYTITGFLARITNSTAKLVPDLVAIGFWGQVVIFEEQLGIAVPEGAN